MIRLALIGRGNWGQNYIKTIKDGIKGVFLPDSNIFGKDYLKDLSKLEADGVIIASPTSTHFQVAKDLINSSFKNLLIEKPIAQTFQESLHLQKLARQKSALIMVGHIQLYDAAIIKMEKSLGLVGDIRKMSYEGLKSTIRTDGTTVIQDWAPHPSYLFLHFASKVPKRISVEQRRGDNVLLRYDFGNITASAKIGWAYPKRKRMFSIEGAKGKLIFDGSSKARRLNFIDSNGKRKLIGFSDNKTALESEILEFADMVKTGKISKSPLSQGVEVMKIIGLAEKSPVEFPKQP